MNSAPPQPAARWPGIDGLRGIALAAMIIYHLVWDLSFFRYIPSDIATSPPWRLFAHVIAASFLFLSGCSFALAMRHGFAAATYRKRLAVLMLAALGVSVVTAFAMPHAPVYFGILHCLAAVSLLLPLMLRLPDAAAWLAAAVFFILPQFLVSTRFDGPGLAWLGLNETPLAAVDHVPLLPWGGWAFAGYAAMRLILRAPGLSIPTWPVRLAPARLLQWAGRHSLAIYLIHQPVILGLLWLGAPAVLPGRDFRASCEKSCQSDAADALFCRRYCGCMEQELQKKPLWSNVLKNALTADELRVAADIAAQCRVQK